MAKLCPSGGRIRAPLWGPESSSVQRMEFIGNDGSSVLTAERERTCSGKGVQHEMSSLSPEVARRSGIFWNRTLPYERI